jgi:hypothetical protein
MALWHYVCMGIKLSVQNKILFVALFLFPLQATAYVTDARYAACVQECEGRFRKVHPDDPGCDEGLRRLRGDLSKLRLYLRSRKICSGRHRRECRALKGQVTGSVARLAALIGPNPVCLDIDHDAIRKELWWLDIAHSCQGDKDYTDIHDLMAKRPVDLRRVTEMGTHYELVRTSIRRHPEYKAFWPSCEGPSKPNRDYIWPLLEFQVALESVGDVQACMATCRAPTQQERALGDLLERLPQLEGAVREVSEALAPVREARDERIRQRLGVVLPCSPLDTFARRVADLAVSVGTLREKSAALEAQEPPGAGAVDDLVRLARETRRGLDALDLSEVTRRCRREEERAISLEVERQRMIRSVMRGGSFSVEAARRFDDLAAPGAECRWTTECRMPLRCADGRCAGAVTLADALPLLQEAEQIGRQARELAVVNTRGLDPAAVDRLEALSVEQRGLQARLEDYGWTAALRTWRDGFIEDLDRQLDVTRAAASEAVEGLEPGLCEGSVEPDACAAAIDGLRDAIKDVGDLRSAAGDGDPIRDPTWVRLRVDELHHLGRRVAQLRADLGTAGAPAPKTASRGGALPVVLFSCLALLAAGGGGGLFLIRRRRRS